MDDGRNRCRSECRGAPCEVSASLRPARLAPQFDRPNSAFANNPQTQQLWPHLDEVGAQLDDRVNDHADRARVEQRQLIFIGVFQTRWGNVTADNRRCRSLSTVTSTTSAARSTMELLRAGVNPASRSYQLMTWSRGTWSVRECMN